jgi:hypothetical protein
VRERAGERGRERVEESEVESEGERGRERERESEGERGREGVRGGRDRCLNDKNKSILH